MINPVKNYVQEVYSKGDVTQWFGENPTLYARFDLNGHNGIDIVRKHGEPMYAIEDATVVEVNDHPTGFGMHVRIVSIKKDKDGVYHEWTYGHCSATFVSIGDEVFAGQHIANMGNTGFVVSGNTPYWKDNPFAGTHLHLGLRLMLRPKTGGWYYVGSKTRLDVIGYDNGYRGAIDPRPYLVGATDKSGQPTIRELQITVIALLKKYLSINKK